MRILCGLLLMLVGHASFSCSCATATLQHDFDSMALVFLGQVTSVESNGEVLFQVSKVWKSDGQPITPVSNTGMGMCSFRFEEGRSYIVFARRFSPGEGQEFGLLWTDSCSHTMDTSFGESCNAHPLSCQKHNEDVANLLEFLFGQAPVPTTR